MKLVLTPINNFPLIQDGDNLASIIDLALDRNHIHLEQNDILVIAQKIVSKAEGRAAKLSDISPSRKAFSIAKKANKDPRLVELILRESTELLRVCEGTIIAVHRLGFICANAGIDHSNVEENIGGENNYVLLLPENPDRSALQIQQNFTRKYSIAIAVLIIDSHGRAWRNGTVGVAIGLSGLPGLVDLRGKPDLFGNTLKSSQLGAADELASAASIVMGQADEGLPVVHVRGFPYPLRESSINELIRPKDRDLFRS